MKFKHLLFVFFVITIFSCNKTIEKADYTEYVNPFIGTAGTGHCFPGACVPFGMIQASPETGNFDWAYCGGYQYDDTTIWGFAQNHISGGIHDLGDLLVQPFSGMPEKTDLISRYDKQSEMAKPGYYSVDLTDNNVTVEITSTEHVAFYKFSYNDNESAHVLVDLQSGLVGSYDVLILHALDCADYFDTDNNIFSGFVKTKVWPERTYYYAIEFSKPFIKKKLLPKRDEREKASRYIFDFDLAQGEALEMKVAMSANSIEGAKHNLALETPDWGFDQYKMKAVNKWNNFLSRVEVKGSNDDKTNFYTSMYHLLIQPHNIADNNDPAWFSTLATWDTYRAAHPLYTILAPEKVDDFVNSMLQQSDKQGFLPIWPLWGVETYCMIGNHSVPVIVDAYLKGFNGFDIEKAYQAVKTSLTVDHFGSWWNVYDEYGYYPFDIIEVESVSKTLESGFDDYCASLFARSLGKEEDYNLFSKRASYYKNLLDTETNFMRGKDSAGNWRTNFDPFELSHIDLGGDYTEGNAWQYTWSVQHDVDGLINLMGGPESFNAKLDTFFTIKSPEDINVLDVTGLIGQYAHGNEPSHHIAYMYVLSGQPGKTQKLVREICQTQYLNKPDGLCGNDDCGQMSAWYIFSSLGFYPVDPCGGQFILGAPQVQKASLKLPGDKVFKVIAEGLSTENMFVQSVELNEEKLTANAINYQDIMSGGILKFYMGPEPLK